MNMNYRRNFFDMTEKITAEQSILSDYQTRELFLAHQSDMILFAQLIDSTLLRINASMHDFEKLFADANQYRFKSVCVPPSYVYMGKQHCTNSLICTVVGFPNGYNTTNNKMKEIDECLHDGADEIDFVQNLTFVKSQNWKALKHEYLSLVQASSKRVTKVILETSVLSDDEIKACTLLAVECGINIIKTSTGFGSRGANPNDIYVIKNALKELFGEAQPTVGIKASGGIRTRKDGIDMLQLGATRIGTSNGAQFMNHCV